MCRIWKPLGSLRQTVKLSWRMNEMSVCLREGVHYHYGPVDNRGKSVASLLRDDKRMEAARAFFLNAGAVNDSNMPRIVNLDDNAASHRALRLLGSEFARAISIGVSLALLA